MATCPLHPEKPATLKITRDYGAILLECPRGCPDHQIAAALGLTPDSLLDLDDFDSPDHEDEEDDDNDYYEDEDDEETAEENLRPSFTSPPLRWNAFDLKPAGEWIDGSRVRPVPRPLFGEFWLENELCILFADTGKGKSILAVQIAESLARGIPIEPFQLFVPGQKVLYFDFELSDKQFETRYSVLGPDGLCTDHHQFSPDFLRAQVSIDTDYPAVYDSWGDYTHTSFDGLIRQTGSRILIIDNITYLSTTSNERAPGALRLMHALQHFKKEYDLSILALAHTPKRRYSRALTVNDLQGSKMMSNFADNVFAIGESCLAPDIRYLKHIKPRNTPMIYGASNVCTYRIEKEHNFLGFNFLGFTHEREHFENLSLKGDIQRRTLTRKARELAAAGITQREIAEHLGISLASVNRYLKK